LSLLKIADGVIATSTLVDKMGRTIIMKDNYIRVNPESKLADIQLPYKSGRNQQ
jgi:hypothetical protein